MAQPHLPKWVPDAPPVLLDMLDVARGPLQPAIRAEIFGSHRFAQHGASLGQAHRDAQVSARGVSFFPRLRSNIDMLRRAHDYIGQQAYSGYYVSPAAEWLLDNFHQIEAQLDEIRLGFAPSYFRTLPRLRGEPLNGLPRIYGVVWAFIAHSDAAFDEELAVHFLNAYQEHCELRLGELWALPMTLRVVLIEDLRRLAERVATNKAARELANLCCDNIERYSVEVLECVLEDVGLRGVGPVFLLQMAQRLASRRATGESSRLDPYHDWLRQAMPVKTELEWQAQQSANQAADNVSVSNAVASLRFIGSADWPEIIDRTSALIRLMVGSALFQAEHIATRDQTLHSIERLSWRSGQSELRVAQALLDLMRANAGADPTASTASFWLHGAGRSRLTRLLGLHDGALMFVRSVLHQAALPAYLVALLLGTVWLLVWLLSHHEPGMASSPAPEYLMVVGVVLMLFPASEAVVALTNRLISESKTPKILPRLALRDGVPPEHRVLVVIPCMLTSAGCVRALVRHLQMHYLANPERHAQFALLSDWADADTPHSPSDDALLADAVGQIRALNQRYPREAEEDEAAPRFIVLHRARVYCHTERRWIGWERKRGKLEQLLAAMVRGTRTEFMDLGTESRIAGDTPYVVTLDSDTGMPPGRLRELVGVAAHPHNLPQLDATGRTVVSGYAILQPHISTPLPTGEDRTLYHWLFAGQCGLDPYSAASSEVYQDLFREGSFTGKGLLNVRAVHAVLGERLPPERVLSHDLLEGSLTRCAAVSDVSLLESAPFQADVAAMRLHRWIRGDWQLLPFLLQPMGYRLTVLNQWKMFDNLRRSLVPPMSLAFLAVSLQGYLVAPTAALALVFAAFSAGPLMGAAADFLPARSDVAKSHFLLRAGVQLLRAMGGGIWHLVQLVQQSLLALDAVVRVLYRMLVSRRHLLQWTTAENAQASVKTDLSGVLRAHWKEPAVALLLLFLLLAGGTNYPVLSTLLCLVWGASAVLTWWASRPHRVGLEVAPDTDDQAYLYGIARDTWRYFECCVGPEERHLPPDNLQISPKSMLAHRTSPTNIGMYLLSVACAREFGWIGTQDLLSRMEATLASLENLQRHRGHFLNWYDTQTGMPLPPMYVSTVDSGNLCSHLLAVAMACKEFARDPKDHCALADAVRKGRERLAPLLLQYPGLLVGVRADSALERLLAVAQPLAQCEEDSVQFSDLLDAAASELSGLMPATTESEIPALLPEDTLPLCLADYVATLRSACRDMQAQGAAATSQSRHRLLALTAAFEKIAGQADFRFLYHPKRHLLHIGYRVEENQFDAGFYDLLASEARLTSLLAVAKGDIPARHWSALGRPIYASGVNMVMRSWSGSMFEYLMPSLVLHEPHGSVLRAACHSALREQIHFGLAQGVPWGTSECAFAGRDHTLAYQYAPQGVPRLALRRTPPDELVVAPYATALAAQIAPAAACRNFEMLQTLGARGRYGFIEALDFSPARRTGDERFQPVATFMAHHQGMSIVSLANVLLDGVAQRWTLANAPFEAVASLLQETEPRELSRVHPSSMMTAPHAQERRASGLVRTVMPDEAAVHPTLVLSNGRYSVTLRANGAGWSSWDQVGITRWRDDALRDMYGSFFYLRWQAQQAPVSITQHPAADPGAHYSSTYHGDRMCFDAMWPTLHARTEVWVSPEDDIELRQVELHNLGDNAIEIELISAFEVTLSDPRADEAHPAFTNLYVRARWLASQQALVFERKPRLVTDRSVLAAHFLADTDASVVHIGIQTDRQRWTGRNHGAANPQAALDTPPADEAAEPAVLDTGLDPVCALAVTVRIAAGAKVQVTFATAASDDASILQAVIDKYRRHGNVLRSSLMSTTLAGIRLRVLRISADNFVAFQTLTTAVTLNLTRVSDAVSADAAQDRCDRRLLWRFGISGDRPLVLVSAGVVQGVGMLRALAQALSLWHWGRVACDMVIVNAEPASYQMELQRELVMLCEHHDAENASRPEPACTALHMLRLDAVSAEELSTLRRLARVCLDADGRPLSHHLQEFSAAHALALAQRLDTDCVAVPVAMHHSVMDTVPVGEFAFDSGDFRFTVSTNERPLRPWINVLANPAFGAQISEVGGGYTWAGNSRMNQLTPWSNDPVSDPPSEWFLLQDVETRQVWSLSCDAGETTVNYRITHGQGYSSMAHHRDDLQVNVTWCVDAGNAVKQVQIAIANHGSRKRKLRVFGAVEWMMGANRADRSTVRTAWFSHRLAGRNFTALLSTQCECSAGFGGGTAFFGLTHDADVLDDWTCDRRELFDLRGARVVPAQLGRSCGDGLDPCAALATGFALDPGGQTEQVFLLGYADDAEAARRLAAASSQVPAAKRLRQVRSTWDGLLGATTVRTPDPLFDVLVNRWLLYQTVSCRMWAKAGFYQAGGATGFRDQLQDAMALSWAAPDMLRAQIVLCASRQFAEGDVQHWWHAPTGAGVRTHCCDDLLWLPHACVHYLRATADATLLDQFVPFIEGPAIEAGKEDGYYVPVLSAMHASVYEHAARSLDRSLNVGAHGLPLMGTGDWNDGMNRVGHEGRGESVWLGWFLCRLVADFAPLARVRGDTARALRWEQAAQGWTAALLGAAWDGEWFKRAFFDNGQALGTHANDEARIDLIAQAWAVLSHVAPPDMQRAALSAMDAHLVDPEAGLIRLLNPPLADATPSAGYIQAYPPGVRENGGQYSHAGVWALMAVADFARVSADQGAGDTCYRYFRYLSPAHRAANPAYGEPYGVEPYVMAGDIYSQPPYVGRGGWSWYTGAAAWLHRAAIGSMFGLQLEASSLSFSPCLPAHWEQAELTLTREGRTMRFILLRSSASAATAAAQKYGAQLLNPGQALPWTELALDSCFVIPMAVATTRP